MEALRNFFVESCTISRRHLEWRTLGDAYYICRTKWPWINGWNVCPKIKWYGKLHGKQESMSKAWQGYHPGEKSYYSAAERCENSDHYSNESIRVLVDTVDTGSLYHTMHIYIYIYTNLTNLVLERRSMHNINVLYSVKQNFSVQTQREPRGGHYTKSFLARRSMLRDGPLFFWRGGGGGGWKISLCKLFFLSMHLCKQFFSNNTFLQTIFFSIFFNHDLTQKGGSLLLPSIII